MKPTQFTLMIGAALIVIVAVVLMVNGKQTVKNTNQVSTSARYCGSDGDLVGAKPIQSHRSYCIKTDASSFTPDQPADVAFQIIDDQGLVLKDFDVVHEKIMHVILVRKDLTNFQHIHPEYEPSSGTFNLNNVTVADNGPYRLFADFTPTSSQKGPNGVKLPVVDHVDVAAGSLSQYNPVALDAANSSDSIGAYNVSLDMSPTTPQSGQTTTLTFTITENGKKVTDLERYLGELGHTVVLEDGDLSFLHTHPIQQKIDEQNGSIAFEVTFPEAGQYKSFMQFQHRGSLQTVEFVFPQITSETADSESKTNDDSEKMFH